MDSASLKIIKKVKDFYLSSRDFNGVTLEELFKYMELKEKVFKSLLIQLIQEKFIDLIYEGDIPNPHIKPFPAPPITQQINKLNSFQISDHIKTSEENAESVTVKGKVIKFFVVGIGCCVYPTPQYLKTVVDWKHYVSRPFTLRLAMGEWQLKPYYFESGILAIYRNDPRYRYKTDDVSGSLYSFEENLLIPSDQIYLKQFGFGFDENGTRVVVVLLTDLHRLSAEHQRIWFAKMLKGFHRFKLHPDYRKEILGHFPEKNSIFTAFQEELRIINEMSDKIKGVSFFKEIFDGESKPENFGFLILPTLREFEMFCHTLDRMMGDNMNEAFFDGEILNSYLRPGQTLENLNGQKITKLDIWVSNKIRFSDIGPKDDMIKTFRDIRDLRSKPAHSHYANKWDLKYIKDQKNLVARAYTAIRTLRLIFANHRNAKAVKVPDWLYEGDIRTF